MNPSLSDVHVNSILTNISVAYIQDAGGFVADRVFPAVPVAKQSDLYFKYDMADWNRDNFQKRAPATQSAVTGWKITTDSYIAAVWSLAHDIDDQVRANSDAPLSMDADATRFITQQAMISKEVQFASNYFTTGIWTGSSTGTDLIGSAKNNTGEDLRWDDPNSDPIGDIAREMDAVKLASTMRPNKMVIGAPVWTALKNHPDILDRIKYGGGNASPAIISKAAVAAIFELDELLVMDAVQATNAENPGFETSMVTSFIGGKSALLLYVAPAPGLQVPSAGYTFNWTGLIGAAGGIRILSYRRQPEIPADRVEGQMAYAQKVVAARCGAFWTTIVN